MHKNCLLFLACLLMALTATAQIGPVKLRNTDGSTISVHSSITEAYNAIPDTINKPYLIELDSTYTVAFETFPITFGVKNGTSATNTITLRPEAGVSHVNIKSGAYDTLTMKLDDADWIIIDGRAGGIGHSQNMSITATFYPYYGQFIRTNIRLINGATNNIIRNCNIELDEFKNIGINIDISTSDNNLTGNSDNQILFNRFIAGLYSIECYGTAANPNRRTLIKGNKIVDFKYAGIYWNVNSGSVHIDSNELYNTHITDYEIHAIGLNFSWDTAIITRNKIHTLPHNPLSYEISGMIIFPKNNNLPNYSLIANNMISLGDTPTYCYLSGIKILGPHPTHLDIFNNTIRIGATQLSYAPPGVLQSAALLIENSNALTHINVRNNILHNGRIGAFAGTQHLSIAVINTNIGLTSDQNALHSATGQLARIGSTVYTSLPAYQAAAAPNDANSDTASVQFVSLTDLHLSGNSPANPALLGTPLSGITDDIDGHLRSAWYRGADEYLQPCTGIPAARTLSATADTVCSFTPVSLYASGGITAASLYQRWQWRPEGSGSFTDIPGATGLSYSLYLSQSMDFRLIDSCGPGGLTSISDTITVFQKHPIAGTIYETHAGLTYNFFPDAIFADTYEWNFGDGAASSTQPAPTHTYSQPGTYTVRLIVTNECGRDTAFLTIQPGMSVGHLQASSLDIQVFPNPAQDLLHIQSVLLPLQELSLIDAKGSVVLQHTPGSLRETRLNLQALPNGIYILRIQTERGVIHEKINVLH